jgi:hypothetical protein
LYVVSLTKPFHLDFVNISLSVFDILQEIYNNLQPNEDDTNMEIEMIAKIDLKLWRTLVVPILKDIDTIASRLVQLEQGNLKSFSINFTE